MSEAMNEGNNPAPRSNPNLVPVPSFHSSILAWGKPTFLFKRKLDHGEFELQHPRLAIFMKDEQNVLDFMTEEEKNTVETKKGKYGFVRVITKEAISAKKQYDLDLKRMKGKLIHDVLVFENEWGTLLRDHFRTWKYGDSVHGYGFRTGDGKFRMALHHIEKPRDADGVGNSNTNSPAGNKRNRRITDPDVNDPPRSPPNVLPEPSFHPTILADTRPVLLFSKELEQEDCLGVKELKIKNVEVLMKFMNRREKASLDTINSGLRVIAREAESALKPYTFLLAKVGNELVFRHGWSQFVDDFDLKIGDSVEGWGYRSSSATGEFRLALKIARKEFHKKETEKTTFAIKDPVKKRSTVMLDHPPPPINVKRTPTKKR